MSAVAYRNTEAGARKFVPDEGIDLQKRYRRERLIEQARRWNKESDEEQAASIMRKRGMPLWIREIVLSVSHDHKVSPVAVLGRRRRRELCAARNEVWYRVRERDPLKYTWPMIASWFERDHTTVLYGAIKHAHATGKPVQSSANMLERKLAVLQWHRTRKAERVSNQHVRDI